MKTNWIFNCQPRCAQYFIAVSLLGASFPQEGMGQSPPKVTVRLSQAVYWTTEGNDTVWLTVERGNDVEQEPFTVEYATSDLTAKTGVDYEVAED